MTLHVNSVSNDSLIQQSLSPSSVKNQSYPKVTLQNDSVSFAGAEKANKKSKAKKWIAGLATVLVGAMAALAVIRKGKVSYTQSPVLSNDNLKMILKSDAAEEFIKSSEKQKAKIISDVVFRNKENVSTHRQITKEFPSGTKVMHEYIHCDGSDSVDLGRKVVKTAKAESASVYPNTDDLEDVVVLYKDGKALVKSSYIAQYPEEFGLTGKLQKNSKGVEYFKADNVDTSKLGSRFGKKPIFDIMDVNKHISY